jgi:hypothetical protein
MTADSYGTAGERQQRCVMQSWMRCVDMYAMLLWTLFSAEVLVPHAKRLNGVPLAQDKMGSIQSRRGTPLDF